MEKKSIETQAGGHKINSFNFGSLAVSAQDFEQISLTDAVPVNTYQNIRRIRT